MGAIKLIGRKKEHVIFFSREDCAMGFFLNLFQIQEKAHRKIEKKKFTYCISLPGCSGYYMNIDTRMVTCSDLYEYMLSKLLQLLCLVDVLYHKLYNLLLYFHIVYSILIGIKQRMVNLLQLVLT